ncbi:hypothetical protein HK102_013745 [Quaeritorhiza haematococci]|nr:hypothetical protein HK102_013745 [Quaeritorhiza haematococci]
MTKFIRNPEKLVIQIGAWLRDSYAIHELDLLHPSLHKAALRGKCMENHFAPEDLSLRIQAKSIGLDATLRFKGAETELIPGNKPITDPTTDLNTDPMCWDPMCRTEPMCRTDPMCRDAISNKYIQGMVKSVSERHTSVKVIETVSDQAYDDLLSRNIVFLKLVDASAVNTLIE